MTLRAVRMPGPPRAERVTAVAVGAVPIDHFLQPGARLLDALADLVVSLGVESACVTLTGGGLGPFAYVIPALSPDASHAAFYSDSRRPEGITRLEIAAVTVGFRDGLPFFHCHALWNEASGQRGCGHVLADETMIAAPIRVQGAGIAGARFEATPDPETGFPLFLPQATGTIPSQDARPAVAFRLAPNQELTPALEHLAAQFNLGHARLHGGVASIIGARFADGRQIEGFATELLVKSCTVGGPSAPTTIDIAIVDLHGTIAEGILAQGDNPVLMTFEGLLASG